MYVCALQPFTYLETSGIPMQIIANRSVPGCCVGSCSHGAKLAVVAQLQRDCPDKPLKPSLGIWGSAVHTPSAQTDQRVCLLISSKMLVGYRASG